MNLIGAQLPITNHSVTISFLAKEEQNIQGPSDLNPYVGYWMSADVAEHLG